MRTPGTSIELKSLVTSETTKSSTLKNDPRYASQLAYHEMADIPLRQTDLLEQLESNMKQLNDLQNRMQFMMKEIRYLMKV